MPSATLQRIFSQGLSFLWLEITAKCNLECAHCYADSGPGQQLLGSMSTKDWLTVLHDSRSMGCRQVQFIGGEPTLHPDLSLMISFAAAQGYSLIEVYTNATRINDQLLRSLQEHRVRVAVSFYSDDSVIHDQITKVRGSFNRTVDNIRRMLSAGLKIRAGVIEMAENAGRTEDAVRFLRELGVAQIDLDFMRGIGRGAHALVAADPFAELCGECWKGKLCVTSAARTYPCVFSRFADLGSAKDGIAHILGAENLRNFRLSLSHRNLECSLGPCNPQTCNPQTFPQCTPPGTARVQSTEFHK